MIAIGYVRVSTQEQVDSGLSLESQERRIRQYAEYKELDVVEIIKEEGVSGGTPLFERDGGKKIKEKMKKGEKFAIIAVALDRLFRDTHDCLGACKIWEKEGIGLHLMNLGVDVTTAMGKAFLTNAATYAELEKNLVSERTKEALAQIQKQGGILGGDRFGWDRTEELDQYGRRKLIPNNGEIDTLIECKTLRELGLTYKQIANKFNDEGKQTKKGGYWHASTVRNYCLKKVSK